MLNPFSSLGVTPLCEVRRSSALPAQSLEESPEQRARGVLGESTGYDELVATRQDMNPSRILIKINGGRGGKGGTSSLAA